MGKPRNPFPSESRDCTTCAKVCTGIYVEANPGGEDDDDETALIVCLECRECDGTVLAVRHEGLWFCRACWRKEVAAWKD